MGQPSIPLTPKGTSLAGKTAIITGGNAGIGYDTARQYLLLGASRVIIAVRSRTKGEEAASSLRTVTREENQNAVVDVFDLDLDDFESVVSFASQVKSQVSELDILLLNGGVNIMSHQRSASGHERVMQVNVYSNAVLALELLPLLRSTSAKRGKPSRLTIVGSMVQFDHSMTKKPMQANSTLVGHFDDEKNYAGTARYSDSKLGVAALVQQLAAHVPASEVIINDPCPGIVSTGLDKHLPTAIKYLLTLYRMIAARNVEEGARTVVFASAVAGPETHGKFLQHNKVDPPAPILDQPAGKTFSEKLWSEMIAETSKLDPTFVKP